MTLSISSALDENTFFVDSVSCEVFLLSCRFDLVSVTYLYWITELMCWGYGCVCQGGISPLKWQSTANVTELLASVCHYKL